MKCGRRWQRWNSFFSTTFRWFSRTLWLQGSSWRRGRRADAGRHLMRIGAGKCPKMHGKCLKVVDMNRYLQRKWSDIAVDSFRYTTLLWPSKWFAFLIWRDALVGINSVNLASQQRYHLFGQNGSTPLPRGTVTVPVFGGNPEFWCQFSQAPITYHSLHTRPWSIGSNASN